MENVMTNGFCELNENEMMEVEGGATPFTMIRGVAGAALAVTAVIAAPVTGVLLFGAVATGVAAMALIPADI